MITLLVTGAGRGIGRELCKQALAKDWTVYGSVRSGVNADELSSTLPGISLLQFDVTDYAAIEAAGGTLDAPIALLFSNVGSPRRLALNRLLFVVCCSLDFVLLRLIAPA